VQFGSNGVSTNVGATALARISCSAHSTASGRLGHRLVEVGDHDVGISLCKCVRRAASDSAAAACDHSGSTIAAEHL
jgi:hypothetical protein